MAEEVQLQQEGLTTLHLRHLRKKWQILSLQVLATISLLWMFMLITRTYGACDPAVVASANSRNALYWCPAYDHTLTLAWMQAILADAMSDPSYSLPLPDWMTGAGNSGDGRYFMPIVIISLFTAGWVALGSQTALIRRRVSIGILGVAIVYLAGIFTLTWLWGMFSSWSLYLPFGQTVSSGRNHAEHLIGPLTLYIQLFIMLLVFVPIVCGLLGIWNLSKRMLSWAVTWPLLFLGFHALLSYEGVRANFDVGLETLPSQIGEATEFGGLMSPQIAPLLLIAVLFIVFLESAFAVIRQIEYAFRLPESCKKDPEYVRQFENVMNHHLVHTVGVMFFVWLVSALAIKFDDLIISLVGLFEGNQWSEQVRESLELQLTYGTVISAMVFVVFVAGLRYIVPWQRIIGFIEVSMKERSEQPAPVVEEF